MCIGTQKITSMILKKEETQKKSSPLCTWTRTTSRFVQTHRQRPVGRYHTTYPRESVPMNVPEMGNPQIIQSRPVMTIWVLKQPSWRLGIPPLNPQTVPGPASQELPERHPGGQIGPHGTASSFWLKWNDKRRTTCKSCSGSEAIEFRAFETFEDLKPTICNIPKFIRMVEETDPPESWLAKGSGEGQKT